MLTLTGAGGTGKTQLALEVAGNLLEQFSDGVFLVELSPITFANVALHMQGVLARLRGDLESALGLYEESLRLAQSTGDNYAIGVTLAGLEHVTYRHGDLDRSTSVMAEALGRFGRLRDRRWIARCFHRFGRIARARGEHERAGRLLGAVGARQIPDDRDDFDRDVGRLRERLGAERFSVCWDEGCLMSMEQAIHYALETPGNGDADRARA